MPKIVLTTILNAPIEICFDLSRSIDLHKISTAKTSEEAIDGVTTGLIGLNEFVTWRASHFGFKQKLTSKITEFQKPTYFKDEQIKGIFKSFYHEHKFEQTEQGVLMTDVFDFHTPLGVLGKIVNRLILTRYLTKLLAERNAVIRQFAESDEWKKVLNREEYCH